MKIVIAALFAIVTVPCGAQGVAALAATAHYISASGSDSNNGLTPATAWASPNHAVNCADILWASSGAYSFSNFGQGKWGAVNGNCGGPGHIARLSCSTFDGCKITATGTNFGMYIDHSYWSVQGWEVSTTSSGFSCFAVAPPTGATAGIHHIILANDIANGCGGGGFSTFHIGAYSVDYVAIVGSIAYNAAQNSTQCYSGISIFEPVAFDTAAGTHIFVGGDYSFGNQSPGSCPFGAASDGIIFDSFDGSGTGGTGVNYTPQAVAKNNISVANGGAGFETQNYTPNPVTALSNIYAQYNTFWGNRQSTVSATSALCAEFDINLGYGIKLNNNLAQAIYSTKCPSSNTMRAAQAYDTSTASGSDISSNYLFAASGVATYAFNNDGQTFTISPTANTTGNNPNFSAPGIPLSPTCGAYASVWACMNASVISNFTATRTGASAYGFQPISFTNGSDPLFPKFACGNIPSGLVSMSC